MFSRRKSSNAHPPMHAMVIDGQHLKSDYVPMPACKPNEVLVKVAYTAVNRADLLQLAGNYLPPEGASPLLGLEVSGTIAAMGEKVIGWSIGEEVCALLSGGGYAEYVTVAAEQLLAPPPRISLKDAASLPEACATAYMALAQEAELKPGERVLIHGGSSGVGIILAQVARAWGAYVFATAGGEQKAQFVQSLGVHAIDHTAAPFEQQILQATHNEGINVIIDILGAPQVATHFKLLRRGGRLVSLAFLEGNEVEKLRLGSILMKHLRWSGVTLRGKSAAQKATIIEGVHKTIWPYLSTGVIVPVVDSVFPLDQAEKAHNRMQERLHCGKILLEVSATAEQAPEGAE